MPFFNYKAKNQSGQVETGKVEAADRNAAAQVLRDRGLFIIQIKDFKEGFFSDGSLKIKIGSGVSMTELVTFTRQLATMIQAGLSLTQSLKILGDQAKPDFAEIIKQLLADIESGMSLGDALARHPKVFNETYVQLVKAGEAGGALDEIFERLATYMESQKEFKGKVTSALIYPAVVVLVMIGVVILMLVMVIPQLVSVFEEFGAELPLPTKILIGLSNFMVGYWWVLLLAIIAVTVFFFTWRKKEKNRYLMDRFILNMPIVGDLQKKVILADFSSTLSLLLRTGIPVIESLKLATRGVTNLVYKYELNDVQDKVERGVSMAKSIGIYSDFPPIVPQMVQVGEETGQLDEVLAKVASYFKSESDRAIGNIMTAIEPLIMVTLGIGVAFLVLAIILPINDLANQI